MKIYKININQIVVEAENEQQAMEKAVEKLMEVSINDIEVVE